MDHMQRDGLNSLRDRFIEWLGAINYSPKTRINYSRDVGLFLKWPADSTEVSDITQVRPAHLRHYQLVLFNFKRPENGKHLTIGSQVCKLSALRSFFSWLVREQRLSLNPAAGLLLPRLPQRLPRNVLSRKEALRLIESTPAVKPRDIRDRAILEVLYGTGIRRAELLGLAVYDVDFESSTLRIEHGKGGMPRIVPLITSARAALKLYMDEARGSFAQNQSQLSLFVSTRSGGPLDDADVVRIVRKASRRAGITKHVTPHTLRHTCATHLLQGRADIRQIQKLLGHKRLSSTEIYTHVDIGDLRKVVRRCHPRGLCNA